MIYREVARRFSPDFIVCEASEEDLRKIGDWLYPNEPEEMLDEDPNATIFVARRGEEVIGLASLVRYSQDSHLYVGYWIFGLMVKRRYRGMGLGEALHRARIDRARRERASEILGEVREDNYRAIRLLRKLGFEMKEIPELEEILEKKRARFGARMLIMSKSLT